MNNTPHSENLLILIKNALIYFFKDIYISTIGIITSFIAYVLPIKGSVNLLILFFILDVIFGYWSARVVKKEKFSAKIVWGHTMPRLLISLILVTLAFMWDKEYHYEVVSTYKIIGWFISGVLLASIFDNAYKITKWKAFPQLSQLIKDKTIENTNLNIDIDYKENNKQNNN